MLHFILIVHLSQTWLLQIPATASKIKMEGYNNNNNNVFRIGIRQKFDYKYGLEFSSQ